LGSDTGADVRARGTEEQGEGEGGENRGIEEVDPGRVGRRRHRRRCRQGRRELPPGKETLPARKKARKATAGEGDELGSCVGGGGELGETGVSHDLEIIRNKK
jgi:hypothetical protein